MGVTIHFEGKLKTSGDFDTVMHIAQRFAELNGMAYSFFQESDKILLRVKNEEDWDYQGPTKGINIQLHESADPLRLEFDSAYYIQEYCKTQFASIEIHEKIIGLLREIKSFFIELIVNDEGELWETDDLEILKEHFDNVFAAIENLKLENASLDGPYKMEDGRIIDLM